MLSIASTSEESTILDVVTRGKVLWTKLQLKDEKDQTAKNLKRLRNVLNKIEATDRQNRKQLDDLRLKNEQHEERCSSLVEHNTNLRADLHTLFVRNSQTNRKLQRWW